MQTLTDRNREKVRRDRAKKAVALAMHSHWDEAALMNRAILKTSQMILRRRTDLARRSVNSGATERLEKRSKGRWKSRPTMPLRARTLTGL